MDKHPTWKAGHSDILIVDDSLTSRTWTRLQLERVGYHVREAATAQEALAAIADRPPDLILLDVVLPDGNGFDLTRQLRADTTLADMPIILVTTLGDVGSKVRGLEAGANDFLTKPPDEAELRARVDILLRLKRSREELLEEKRITELLYRVSRELSAETDLDVLLTRILSLTSDALGASGGSIVLLDEHGESLRCFSSHRQHAGTTVEPVWAKVLQNGFAAWVVRERRGDIISDTQQDPRWITVNGAYAGTRSAVAAPLIHAGQVIGVLTLTHEEPGRFTPIHLELLHSISAQGAVVVEKARLYTQTERERGKLSAVLTGTADAVVATDEADRVLFLNPAAEQMFGVPAERATGRPLAEVLPLPLLLDLFRREAAALPPHVAEIPMPDQRTLYASVSPVAGVGRVAVIRDISALKELERMRLQAEQAQREQLRRTLECYVGPDLVDQVLSEGGALLERREQVETVVLFADIRRFTSAAARMSPEATVEVLNEFFTAMADAIYRREGTVIDLIGDELMASFGAPLPRPDAALRAVESAIALQQKFAPLRERWLAQWGVEVGLGIGIDRGRAVMGNIGTAERMSFTLIGNVVNRAHRLVEQAGPGEILFSDEVLAAIPPAHRPWKVQEVPVMPGGPPRAYCLRLPPETVMGDREEPLDG